MATAAAAHIDIESHEQHRCVECVARVVWLVDCVLFFVVMGHLGVLVVGWWRLGVFVVWRGVVVVFQRCFFLVEV